MLYYTMLYYTIIYYTVCYVILYYTILYYTILKYTILYYITSRLGPAAGQDPSQPARAGAAMEGGEIYPEPGEALDYNNNNDNVDSNHYV